MEPPDFSVLQKRQAFQKWLRKLKNLLPGVSKEALSGEESEQKSILLALALQCILQSKG